MESDLHGHPDIQPPANDEGSAEPEYSAPYPETGMSRHERLQFNRLHLIIRLEESGWSERKQARRRTALNFLEEAMRQDYFLP